MQLNSFALILAELLINDTWTEYDEHLYKYFTDGTASARDARAYCAAEGAMLVSINAPAEMTYIEEQVLVNRKLSAYIGGTDEEDGTTRVLAVNFTRVIS